MKNIALVLAMAVAMTACKTNKKYDADVAAAKDAGYNSGYSAAQADSEARAKKAANMMVAIQAGIGSGTTISLVKFGKDNPNYVVISAVSGSTTQYVAVDVSTYTTGTSWTAFLATNPSVFAMLTANGDGTFSCSTGCFTLVGGSPVATTNTMVFEKTAGASKDLDKAAAVLEAYKAETLAAGIAAEFGLSEERSIKVAQLAASWNKLAKTRALTDADADAFTKELAGVSMSEMESAEKAMINGSASEMNAVLAKAAAVNGTTSENMADIMSKLFE